MVSGIQFSLQIPSFNRLFRMYVILMFLDSKRKEIENHHLQFFSDNQPMVDTLTPKSSPSSQLMTIIRIISAYLPAP